MKHSIPLLIKLSLVFVILLQSCTAVKGKYNIERVNEHLISKDSAIKMYEEYGDKRIRPLQNQLGFEDTRFVWFSLEDMKAYINYVESIKKENPKEKVSGIRIYFSAYPKNNKIESEHQTVFMTPTVELTNRVDRYAPMNHLPFVIFPENENEPLKGRFEIITELMLQDYKMEDRLNYYKQKISRNRLTSTGTGVSFNTTTARAANNIKVTRTIYNEGEIAPPPPEN